MSDENPNSNPAPNPISTPAPLVLPSQPGHISIEDAMDSCGETTAWERKTCRELAAAQKWPYSELPQKVIAFFSEMRKSRPAAVPKAEVRDTGTPTAPPSSQWGQPYYGQERQLTGDPRQWPAELVSKMAVTDWVRADRQWQSEHSRNPVQGIRQHLEEAIAGRRR